MSTRNVTPLRAIDIPATESHQADNQWFFTDDTMRQYLAACQLFGHIDGSVINTNGTIVGLWYYAEFSSKYPGATTEQMTLAEQEAEDRNERDCFCSGVGAAEGCQCYICRTHNVCLTDDELAGLDNAVAADMSRDYEAMRGNPIEFCQTPEEMEAEARDFDETMSEYDAMAAEGASDEDIAAVKLIDNMFNELNDARTCIGNLLGRIDGLIGPHMLHRNGSTPDWYVEAAAISCGIKLDNNEETLP